MACGYGCFNFFFTGKLASPAAQGRRDSNFPARAKDHFEELAIAQAQDTAPLANYRERLLDLRVHGNNRSQ